MLKFTCAQFWVSHLKKDTELLEWVLTDKGNAADEGSGVSPKMSDWDTWGCLAWRKESTGGTYHTLQLPEEAVASLLPGNQGQNKRT